jgi:tetratricopeptide (TPR) repeat protein
MVCARFMKVAMFSVKRVGLVAAAFWWPLLAWAHGDLHDRIVALTKEIEQSPTNAALYFQRGECHRNHQEWKEAVADFDRVAQLDPSLKRIDFVRGRLWLDANDPTASSAAAGPLSRIRAEGPGSVRHTSARSCEAGAFALRGG